MCLPVLGLIVSAASAAAGLAQSQAQFQAQQDAARRQQDLAYQNAQRQAFQERQQQVAKYTAEVNAHHQANLSYQQQVHNNAEAANRVYVQEQVKLEEAQTKAAFKAQEIYAKSIGNQGTVLAGGMTGQSIGLMALDAERQAGFGLAEQDATVRSAQRQAAVAMETAYIQNASENNLAHNRLPASPQHPNLVMDPVGDGTNLNLGIPAYNWG
jgi:hypothetical protein